MVNVSASYIWKAMQITSTQEMLAIYFLLLTFFQIVWKYGLRVWTKHSVIVSSIRYTRSEINLAHVKVRTTFIEIGCNNKILKTQLCCTSSSSSLYYSELRRCSSWITSKCYFVVLDLKKYFTLLVLHMSFKVVFPSFWSYWLTSELRFLIVLHSAGLREYGAHRPHWLMGLSPANAKICMYRIIQKER